MSRLDLRVQADELWHFATAETRVAAGESVNLEPGDLTPSEGLAKHLQGLINQELVRRGYVEISQAERNTMRQPVPHEIASPKAGRRRNARCNHCGSPTMYKLIDDSPGIHEYIESCSGCQREFGEPWSVRHHPEESFGRAVFQTILAANAASARFFRFRVTRKGDR